MYTCYLGLRLVGGGSVVKEDVFLGDWLASKLSLRYLFTVRFINLNQRFLKRRELFQRFIRPNIGLWVKHPPVQRILAGFYVRQ